MPEEKKMTDAEIIKALECCSNYTGTDSCRECLLEINNECEMNVLESLALDLIKRLKAENDELFYKLQGVMWSVDKWLDGNELKQDEVSRATTMREKTLQITEKQQAEIERYKGVIKLLEKDVITAKSEVIKEFAMRLKTEFLPEQEFDNTVNLTLSVVRSIIDKIAKEMVGE